MDQISQEELSAREEETKQELAEMKAPVEPKLFMRGNRTFMHTVFKLEVEKMKKNTAWKPGVYNEELVEHCHFFHDKDRKGSPQNRCTPTGGHFHDVITHDESGNLLVDENGYALPKVGPPKQFRMVRNQRGKLVKKIVSVFFWDDSANEGEEKIVDNHTHTVANLGSEELSPNKIKQIQQANQAGLAALKKQ